MGRRRSLLPFLFMKTDRFPSFSGALPAALIAASLFFIYLRTLAPGLTWANGGSDGGDLITAAAVGGVAHPSGYPLYLLLARMFQLLPVGSLAFRTNVMSAVFTSLAAGLISILVTQLTSPKSTAWIAGMVAAFAFGFAPLVWSQAVITEVYALQSFLLILVLLFYTAPEAVFKLQPKHVDRLRGLSLGLAMSNHVTTLLLVPVALAIGSFHSQPDRREDPQPATSSLRNLKLDTGSLLRQLAWFAVGLSPYLIIPLRALNHPPVNWGNAVSMERFWWLVTGQLYRSYYLEATPLQVWGHLQAETFLLLQQFGIAGVVLGILGLVVYGSWSPGSILTAWTAIVYIVFASSYSSADSNVYLIPVFLCFAIWIGQGTGGLLNSLTQVSSMWRFGLGILVVGYFAIRSIAFIPTVDASKNLQAEAFGREVLAAAPQNAMLFAQGDRAVFALWYFHFALGERPDLVVLADDLLHFDWYQETIHATYPALTIPGPFPWSSTIARANPLRPVCFVKFSDHTQFECSQPTVPP